MSNLKIRSLTVRGFRAFGAQEQTLHTATDLAVVWGPNSQGKTSLAEAFEFLLTGRISRRELAGGSQDEFANALRNAHLPDTEETSVAVSLVETEGAVHVVERVLTRDYGRKGTCESSLKIDGKEAGEGDLVALGVGLSQPPLQAPVLAQHTLGYVFSVGPQNRATYFKSLLDVTDLEGLRQAVAALEGELEDPEDPLLTAFERCLEIPELEQTLQGLPSKTPSAAVLEQWLDDGARILIAAQGETVPQAMDKRLDAIGRILEDNRNRTFPVREFERKELAGWNPPAEKTWEVLDQYIVERDGIDAETRQLVALFSEALRLPTIDEITDSTECPLCGVDLALTPERVAHIRQHVEGVSGFAQIEGRARSALAGLSESARSVLESAQIALPKYLRRGTKKRREVGFTVARLRELLGEPAEPTVTAWLTQVRSLARSAAAVHRAGRGAREIAEAHLAGLNAVKDTDALQEAFRKLRTEHEGLKAAVEAYAQSAGEVGGTLKETLDEQAAVAGWQEFLDTARRCDAVRAALIGRQARATVRTEFQAALRQLDVAKDAVLEGKFADYSALVQGWWERLRPDEPTYFSTVGPRKGTKRTIDLTAGLANGADRSTARLRDVIAVFSQSQLHCLGLALFLARAQHEGLGFIVLDDPVLSSDEDYRVHFGTTVLSELLDLGIQTIVLTQDHVTWKELETRYRHRGIATAQLYAESRSEGSIIENTSDALLAKINRAKSLARGGHPDARKECGVQLRDATERFCKEMLVANRASQGDASAALADYDGKTLEWLCPRVEPLLVHDASHGGKMQALKDAVNRACHDNAPPSTTEMTHACGEIRHFVKDYLGR